MKIDKVVRKKESIPFIVTLLCCLLVYLYTIEKTTTTTTSRDDDAITSKVRKQPKRIVKQAKKWKEKEEEEEERAAKNNNAKDNNNNDSILESSQRTEKEGAKKRNSKQQQRIHNHNANTKDDGNGNANNTSSKMHYHDYAVFIVHYHKTGYVLSRELKNLVYELEYTVNEQRQQQQRQQQPPPSHTNKRHKFNHIAFYKSGTNETTNERIAFDQIGNWARSAFQVRDHDADTSCPRGFRLEKGTMYVQESPDLYCRGEELAGAVVARGAREDSSLLNKRQQYRQQQQQQQQQQQHGGGGEIGSGTGARGGTKIIHFVRNPFDMVMSNYFYHSQDPTPEKWVHTDDPCQHLYADGESLSTHILPTLAEDKNKASDGTPQYSNSTISQQQFDDIVAMCHSLYQSKRGNMTNKTFYDHLVSLNRWDGLQLASAQMIASSSVANKHLAGGDILRMANNIVRFKELQETHDDIQLLTVSMDDFISNTAENTLKFLDFVFGDEEDAAMHESSSSMPQEVRREASRRQEEKYARKKGSKHVTQTNPNDNKEELRDMLKNSAELGPILKQTEVLVNEAVLKSAAE